MAASSPLDVLQRGRADLPGPPPDRRPTPSPPSPESSQEVRHTTIVMASGSRYAVKGTPEEAETRLHQGMKDEVVYENSNHDGRLIGGYTMPGFCVFEAAESRREVRLRTQMVEAVVGP